MFDVLIGGRISLISFLKKYSVIHKVKQELELPSNISNTEDQNQDQNQIPFLNVFIPQDKPLSPGIIACNFFHLWIDRVKRFFNEFISMCVCCLVLGEVLGCTSPKIEVNLMLEQIIQKNNISSSSNQPNQTTNEKEEEKEIDESDCQIGEGEIGIIFVADGKFHLEVFSHFSEC